ncbi:hypothetical protein LSG31_16860 [Fodinisporobacter ferrooxydans]|uniref:Uncharacterized protein n=1 Tax=Fodinisporobacter ferrooxydans TaxID=2901836 RepID=A0ABY4CGQ6_9BACL|nr:hypothetical protein LSG31_16860 [Alicyclobacillaceae bacterium MYW30-H2]
MESVVWEVLVTVLSIAVCFSIILIVYLNVSYRRSNRIVSPTIVSPTAVDQVIESLPVERMF